MAERGLDFLALSFSVFIRDSCRYLLAHIGSFLWEVGRVSVAGGITSKYAEFVCAEKTVRTGYGTTERSVCRARVNPVRKQLPKGLCGLKMECLMVSSFKNILIIKPSSLGDVVLALPALSALRKSFGDSRISWLIQPEFAPLIEGHPQLDQVILFDRKRLGRAWYHPGALKELLSLIGLLRREQFDLVLDLQGLFRSGSLGWLCGCGRRIGMANAREFATIFYTDKIPQEQNCIHVVDFYLKMVRAAGAGGAEAEFILPTDAEVEQSVEKMLSAHSVDKTNYAVFVPGSRHSYKCWPVGRFAELAGKISAKFGVSIVAVGTSPEGQLIEELKSLAGVPIADFAGRTTLCELVALMRNARLVVCNDTGPGHIAAVLGKPLVMLFGQVNPARLAPYQRPDCVAAVEPYSRGAEIRTDNPKYDVKAITVDEVYEKVCKQLGG